MTRSREDGKKPTSSTTASAPCPMADDLRTIQRQAFSGMMWCKQHYLFIYDEWANGDPAQPPPPPGRKGLRNAAWRHLHCDDILSMPDSMGVPLLCGLGFVFPLLLSSP